MVRGIIEAPIIMKIVHGGVVGADLFSNFIGLVINCP